MPSPEIEEFAKILVRQVRDAAVRSSDQQLRPDVENVVAKRWKEAGRDGNLDSIARVLIPDIVDDTVFYLLQAIVSGIESKCTTCDRIKVHHVRGAGWLIVFGVEGQGFLRESRGCRECLGCSP
jgi:hypothetical protein